MFRKKLNKKYFIFFNVARKATMALVRAALFGNLHKVTDILNSGEDVNLTEALLNAAAKGHLDVVCFLLERGADVNLGEDDGWTPLMYASQNGFMDVAEVLINAGAKINVESKGWGDTALGKAFQKGYSDIARLLVERGADIEPLKKYYIRRELYAELVILSRWVQRRSLLEYHYAH
jgi:ankyrin repeat protein